MSEATIAATVAMNLGKASPALSATSDAPTEVVRGPALSASGREPVSVAEPVADKPLGDEHKATPPAAPDAKVTDAPVEAKPDAKPEPKADSKSDETPAWAKAEVTKERNRRREAETKATEAQTRLDTALKALEAVTQKPAEKTTEAPRPERRNFDTPEAHEAALEAWTTEKVAAATRAETLRQVEEKAIADKAAVDKQAQEAATKVVLDAWTERSTKAVEQFPDFEDVVYRSVEDGGPNITEHMQAAIVGEEDGPAVAYYLATHTDEALRISGLSPARQLREMGRLSERLEVAAKPRLTSVPKPPVHIGSDNTAVTKSMYDIGSDPGGMDAYASRRNEQLRAARH